MDSCNSLSSSSSHMPAIFEPRKATVARRPSRRQSIYAESIYGDIDEAEVAEGDDVNGSCAGYSLAPCSMANDHDRASTVQSNVFSRRSLELRKDPLAESLEFSTLHCQSPVESALHLNPTCSLWIESVRCICTSLELRTVVCLHQPH